MTAHWVGWSIGLLDRKEQQVMALMAQLLAKSGSDFEHMNWGNNGGWWMMLIWGPVFLMGLGALLVWGVHSKSAPSAAGPGSVDPLDGARKILAERYARGELDSEEYQERVERLS